MTSEVSSRGGQPLWRRIHRPSLSGGELLDTPRSIFFGLLGVSAVAGLVLVALIAHEVRPALFDSPISGPPAERSAVHHAATAPIPASSAGSPVSHRVATNRHSALGGIVTRGPTAVREPAQSTPSSPHGGLGPSSPSHSAGSRGATGAGTPGAQPTGAGTPAATSTPATSAPPSAASQSPPAAESSKGNERNPTEGQGHPKGNEKTQGGGPPAHKESHPQESPAPQAPQPPPAPVESGASTQEEPASPPGDNKGASDQEGPGSGHGSQHRREASLAPRLGGGGHRLVARRSAEAFEIVEDRSLALRCIGGPCPSKPDHLDSHLLSRGENEVAGNPGQQFLTVGIVEAEADKGVVTGTGGLPPPPVPSRLQPGDGGRSALDATAAWTPPPGPTGRSRAIGPGRAHRPPRRRERGRRRRLTSPTELAALRSGGSR